MFTARRFRVWLLLAVSLVSGAAFGADTYQLDIPQQPLTKALQAFGEQAGLTVVHYAVVTENKMAPALEGRYTREAALSKLLESSGLRYEYVNTQTIAIRAAEPPEAIGQPASHVTEVQTVSALVLAQAEVAPQPGSQANGTPGTMTGQVSDEISGHPLAGALVRVLESGQTVATSTLGVFRLHGLPAGQYTLSISYLGYADRLWGVNVGPGDNAPLEFALAASAIDLGEVTIFGNRSSRALSLNQQRTADNTQEVVSADLLGNFTGTTISEALRHVSGVTFQRDGVSGAGSNIMIRGLQPEMNIVKFNGLNLPFGDGFSRAASLNNLLADSVSKITINKTLLASHDSSGTGGLVEIETKSPLERAERYVNLAVEGGRRGGDYGDNFLVSGTVSGIFGSGKNFGLSASAQYSEATHLNSTFRRNNLLFGQYLPLSPQGTPTLGPGDLDPRLTFPYEPGDSGVYTAGGDIGLVNANDSTLAVTLSGEWQPTARSSLKLDVQHSKNVASDFEAQGSVSLPSSYSLRNVAALGEMRQALQYGGIANVAQGYNIDDDITNITDSYSLRGSTNRGKLQLNYTLGFARGEQSSPHGSRLAIGYRSKPEAEYGEDLPASAFLPEAVDPVEGIIITPYQRISGEGLILPLFTPATWDFFNNADNYSLQFASQSSSRGSNGRGTGDLTARYELGWRSLKYLEAGLSFEKSRFRNSNQSLNAEVASIEIPSTDPDFPFGFVIYPSLAPIGLHFTQTDLSRVGSAGQGFNYLDEAGVRDFFANLETYARNPDVIRSLTLHLPTDIERRSYIDERNLAAYLQGKFDFGKLEIIPGVRLSRVTVHSAAPFGPRLIREGFFDEDLEFARRHARLLEESATVVDLLPRVSLNFRQTDNLVFRGGYYLTTARPQLGALRSQQTIELQQNKIYSPNGDKATLTISTGNPALEPALTHNFDLEAEWYDGNVGLIRLGGFYKDIENALQNFEYENLHDLSGVALPDDPAFAGITAENTIINLTRPGNNSSPSTLWGVEAHVERQFTFLPGFWSGLGVFANFTYTDSRAKKEYSYYAPIFDADGNVIGSENRVLFFPNERFSFQAATSGTYALTYNKRGIDASLSYGFQEGYVTDFTPNNIDTFAGAVSTLDLRLAYFFDWGGVKWRTFFEGTDLLKGTKDTDLLSSMGGSGIGKYYTSGTYLGGREFRLGIATTF